MPIQKGCDIHCLVIFAQGMGNTLLGKPLLYSLRQEYPNSKITVLAWANGSDAILKKISIIDELHVMSLKDSKIKTLFIYLKKFRSMKITHCIVTWPGGIFSSLLAIFSGANIRVGHRLGYFPRLSCIFFSKVINWENNVIHDFERNYELVEELGINENNPNFLQIELSPSDIGFAKLFINNNLKNNHQFLFGIAPGSGKGQKFKRWPFKHYTEVIKQLIKYFSGDIILFIGKDEEDLVFDIKKDLGYLPTIVIGKTIHQVAAVMKRCSLIIANDSGLMHVAAAVGTPVIGIFGPTDPVRTRPYGNNNKVVSLTLPCSPCYDHFKPKFRCMNQVSFKCMQDLNPEIILAEVKNILINYIKQ